MIKVLILFKSKVTVRLIFDVYFVPPLPIKLALVLYKIVGFDVFLNFVEIIVQR